MAIRMAPMTSQKQTFDRLRQKFNVSVPLNLDLHLHRTSLYPNRYYVGDRYAYAGYHREAKAAGNSIMIDGREVFLDRLEKPECE